MSQQINLLGPAFRKKKFSFTSAAAIAGAMGIAAALGISLAVYENILLTRVEAQARTVAKSFAGARAQQEAAAIPRKADPGAEAKLTQLAADLKARQEVLNALNAGTVGTTGGFSEYLRAFSRQRVEGVWLTAFDIAAGGLDLTIDGRALSADLVPAYLQRLNNEPPMQGRKFASVIIAQPGVRETAKAADAKESATTAALPPFLDFTISSGELGAKRGAGGQNPRS